MTAEEQAVVAAYALRQWEQIVSLEPPSYVSRRAKADPEGWRQSLCELVAADPKRVQAILEQSQRGFTLIELSIVLVIIGLIVGGVLVGQDLIRAAGERATVTQVERFNQAVNTFFGKYGALPGDLNEQVAKQFGFTPRGQYAGQGDGNGVLEGASYDIPNNNYGWIEGVGETSMFWVDLTTANGLNVNLVDGSFSTASPTANPPGNVTGSALNDYFPSAKIGGGNSFYVYSNTYSSGGNSINYFGLSAVTTIASSLNGCVWCIGSNPGLTVKQAYDIDKKIDDGLPGTGTVLAQYLDAVSFGGTGPGDAPNAATASSTTCYDTTSGNYSVTQNGGAGINCALSFKMQGGD